MEGSTNRNKIIRCKVCSKCIRSDNLKRHMGTHKDILVMSDDEAREELRARHAVQLHREERRQEIKEIALQEGIPTDNALPSSSSSVLDTSNLEEALLDDNKDYLDRIELGKQIAAIIDKGVVREESLANARKEALDLYRKQMPRIDIQSVQLRPWQAGLMTITQHPSQREIIWICGFNGNEGKSWFQGYLESFYGYARVARLDLRDKTGNILHTLSKRPLQTTDIFLFNDTRATDHHWQNYAVLEHIKDGSAISPKYNSKVLSFKTPNILILFSNSRPDSSQLSRDRWRIYSINKDGLQCLNKRR